MSDDQTGRRSYSESEIRFLIQRATQLHEEAKGDSPQQLSLHEIEHIAEELGLSADDVRSAALELEIGQDTKQTRGLFGGPFVINHSRVVRHTMSDDQWDEILLDLRAETGLKGDAEKLGRAREWRHVLGEGEGGTNFVKTRIVVRPDDERTTIQLEKRFAGAAIPILAITAVLTIAITLLTIEGLEGLGLSTMINWLIFAGVVGGSMTLVRYLIISYSNRKRKQFKEIGDNIDRVLSSGKKSDDSMQSQNSNDEASRTVSQAIEENTKANVHEPKQSELLDLSDDDVAVDQDAKSSQSRRRMQ